MGETYPVIDRQRITYEGLFNVSDLYHLITQWFREKGYDRREFRNFESITPTGKFIEIWMKPWKRITFDVRYWLQIRMIFEDIQKVEVEKEGTKVKMHQGKLVLVFDCYIETDIENRWIDKPMLYFIRTIYDKYIYKNYMDRYKFRFIEEISELQDLIRTLLNMYKYSARTWTAPSFTSKQFA